MRITQDMLIKIAKDHVAKRIRREKDLVAVYLTGSVSEGEPLLGGSTDIDLIFVHKEEPPLKREVLRVTYEISLDIEHHHQSFYTYHRRLRQNPRIGFALCNHQNILHDKDHWLEFIQASVSARFDSPENVYGRAQQFGENARTLWFDLDDPQEVAWEDWIALYFKAVGTAANAIACLNGPALTTRRFMLAFTSRAEALDLPVTRIDHRDLPWETAADQVVQDHATRRTFAGAGTNHCHRLRHEDGGKTVSAHAQALLLEKTRAKTGLGSALSRMYLRAADDPDQGCLTHDCCTHVGGLKSCAYSTGTS